MSKEHKIVLIVVLSVILIFALLFAVGSIFSGLIQNHRIHIFADIDECASLETKRVDGWQFTKYADATSDKNAKNLEFTAFFGGKFTCESFDFEIFAYEFSDATNAQTYFKVITGKDPGGVDPNYSLESGASDSRLVVYNGNNAYAIFFPTNALSDVLQLLSEIFSVKIS